jgi:GAF domain-containing protein/anti-sigma regulatory factor (Ser/Thr protein kinase)
MDASRNDRTRPEMNTQPSPLTLKAPPGRRWLWGAGAIVPLAVGVPLASEDQIPWAWVAWTGWGTAVLVAGLFWWACGRRLREAALAERQVQAMKELARSTGVLSSKPGGAREALDGLARAGLELLRTRNASVWVLDAAGERIESVARAGYEPRPHGTTYSLDEVPGTRACVRTGELVVVDDVLEESDARTNRPLLRAHGLRSAMFVPLVAEGRVIGTLFLGHDRPRAFGEADRRVARLLGSQAGVILANLRLYEQKDAALAAQEELTRRHDALYQIATEIFRAQDVEASLQRMADAAPALLGVDLCVVGMREGAEGVRIVAVTGNFANTVGERYEVGGTNIGRVWESKRPLVIEDAPNDPSVSPRYRYRMHVGSVMYLPLMGSDGEAIGAMTLVRHAPGAFPAAQRDMADLLAARAAVAIETAQLHEASRRAAQTQAMLLRELNHRVKNNLASIVALLAMDRPPMPADAQAWVNRVGERIATMARTHELFVGGNDRIDLRELVAKLLPALALIKPAGADVRTELGDVRVELGTERAVSLAMVLNELCWNGLEHGTRAGGVLWVRGRGPRDGRIVLEVEDQGGDCDPVPAPSSNGHGQRALSAPAEGRGTGLRLVEGLVSRELGGRFSVARSAGGGTVARVEIPMEDGGAAGVS